MLVTLTLSYRLHHFIHENSKINERRKNFRLSHRAESTRCAYNYHSHIIERSRKRYKKAFFFLIRINGDIGLWSTERVFLVARDNLIIFPQNFWKKWLIKIHFSCFRRRQRLCFSFIKFKVNGKQRQRKREKKRKIQCAMNFYSYTHRWLDTVVWPFSCDTTSVIVSQR